MASPLDVELASAASFGEEPVENGLKSNRRHFQMEDTITLALFRFLLSQFSKKNV
jgi:hypothetical protein